jgi:hypothetical protein
VQPVKSQLGKTTYRIAVAARHGVPRFHPRLPRPPAFYLNDEFRDLLLAKLINGERFVMVVWHKASLMMPCEFKIT